MRKDRRPKLHAERGLETVLHDPIGAGQSALGDELHVRQDKQIRRAAAFRDGALVVVLLYARIFRNSARILGLPVEIDGK